MDIHFKINKTDYNLTSDKRNWILYPSNNPKEVTYFSTIGGLLEDLYQVELRQGDIKSFKALALHSQAVQKQITSIERRFRLGAVAR